MTQKRSSVPPPGRSSRPRSQAGSGLEQLFQQQVDPSLRSQELAPSVDFAQLKAAIAQAKDGPGEVTQILRCIGSLTLATRTVPETDRLAVTASRLPVHTWPPARLLVVAVDVESGERRVFEWASGIELIDAVTASCAVPGIWPPVPIGDHRYMDGGVHSTENADLAAGYERVLVLGLTPRVPPIAVVSLQTALDKLRDDGARVQVTRPDEATEVAFAAVGGNLLDPSVREPAARCGREQGRRIAAQVADLWQ